MFDIIPLSTFSTLFSPTLGTSPSHSHPLPSPPLPSPPLPSPPLPSPPLPSHRTLLSYALLLPFPLTPTPPEAVLKIGNWRRLSLNPSTSYGSDMKVYDNMLYRTGSSYGNPQVSNTTKQPKQTPPLLITTTVDLRLTLHGSTRVRLVLHMRV